MSYQIQLRSDTSTNWTLANPILSAGEPGFETDTGILKIGDGTSTWSALQEISGGSAYGAAVVFKGTLDTVGQLPSSGNTASDAYLILSDSNMRIWDGSAWINVGPLRGPTGPTGATGATGADSTVPGPANTLTVGSVTKATDDTAVVTITGTSPNQTIDFTLPRGLQGIQGEQGIDGPANELSVGTVTTGDPGTSAVVEITGSSPNQTINFTIPEGLQGETGPQGIQGEIGLQAIYQTASGVIEGQRKVYVANPSNVGSTGTGLVGPVAGDLWFW
jgi:hypothetical protein